MICGAAKSIHRIWRFQRKRRDLDIEPAPAGAGHLIGAVHHTHRRFQRAPRRIFERFARREDRLLAYHSRAFYFFGILERVGYDPVSADQLDRLDALVGNADRVLEHPRVLQRMGVLRRVSG